MNSCGIDEINYLNISKKYFGDKSPVLLDIGGNIGDFVDSFFQVYPNGKAYTFEPIPEIFNQLYKRFENDARVTAFNVGLYNEPSENKKFYFLKDSSGMSSIHYRPVYFPRFDTHEISVKLIKLDDMMDIIPHVDYVKIDTEGSELMVLEGGINFLKEKNPKFIQWEYGGCYIDSKTKGADVVKLLDNLGYYTFNQFFAFITCENFIENNELQNYFSIKKE